MTFLFLFLKLSFLADSWIVLFTIFLSILIIAECMPLSGLPTPLLLLYFMCQNIIDQDRGDGSWNI